MRCCLLSIGLNFLYFYILTSRGEDHYEDGALEWDLAQGDETET